MNDYSELRARHREGKFRPGRVTYCVKDGEYWPCRTASLLDEVERLRAALERIAHRTERIVNKEVKPMTAYAAAHYDLEGARAALNSSPEVTG